MHQVSITHYQTLQHQRLIFNQKKRKTGRKPTWKFVGRKLYFYKDKKKTI